METFSALLAICAGNSPVTGEFPAQRPVTRSFDAFFDLHLNKRLSKQSWGWWFETLSHPLLRHCNDMNSRKHSIPRPYGWAMGCLLWFFGERSSYHKKVWLYLFDWIRYEIILFILSRNNIASSTGISGKWFILFNNSFQYDFINGHEITINRTPPATAVMKQYFKQFMWSV